MRFSTLTLVLGTAASQRVVPMRFSRQQGNGLTRRADNDGPLSQTLLNNLTTAAYYVQAAVGTPPQPALFILDTGSSDAWVLSEDADVCNTGDEPPRCPYTFDPDDSDSFKLVVEHGFNITYVSGETGAGDYFTDAFHIAGISVEDLQLGLAHSAFAPLGSAVGALGVGFDATEAAEDKYPNLITSLMDQGFIDTAAYSLFLDGRDADHGTILFGGIDTAKYSGDLQVVEMVRDSFTNQFTSLTIDLDGLDITVGSGDNVTTVMETSVPVTLDSGATLTYLPDDVVADIYKFVGVYDDTAKSGLAYVSCSIVDSDDFKDATFDYKFGGSDGGVIRVDLQDLVFDYVKGYIQQGFQIPDDLPFKDPCEFGIQSIRGYNLLGDSFLRSAYVVYDLSDRTIGLAQAVYDSDSSKIVEITKDGGIPGGTSGDGTSSSSSAPVPTSTSGQTSTTPPADPSPTDGSTPDATPTPTDPDSAAPRLAPRWNGESGAVMLISLTFGLMGAMLFAL